MTLHFFGGPTTVPPIFLHLPIVVGQQKILCVFLMVVDMRHFGFYPKFFEKNFISLYDFAFLWAAYYGSPDYFTSSNCRRATKLGMCVPYSCGYAAFGFLHEYF